MALSSVCSIILSLAASFAYQLEGRFFSLVEVVSTCPTNWGMTPQEAVEWTEKHLLTYYKLGEYKFPETTEEAQCKAK